MTECFYRDDGLVVGAVGSVAVVIWRKEVTEHRFAQQARNLARVVAQAPGGQTVGFVCVVEEGTPPPSSSFRAASVAMLMEHRARLFGVAGIVEGEGFKASITRSILTGMQLMARRGEVQAQFFASVDQGVRWLASQSRGLAPGVVASEIEALRRVTES
jgi:hypothetical protein